MDPRRPQGQEEHQQDLAVNRGPDLLLRHAHLAADVVAPLVLIAFGDLLVVDDEDGGHEEEDAKEHPQEQKATVHGIELLGVALLAVKADAVLPQAQAVHQVLGLGQLFRVVLSGQVQLDAELAGGALPVQGHEILRRLPIRDHQEQLCLLAAQQNGGGVADGLRDPALDVEGVSLQVKGRFNIRGGVFVVVPGDAEIRGEILQAGGVDQHLARGQADSPARQAGVVLRRHHLQQRPLGIGAHVQREHAAAPPAVHPVAVIIPKVLDITHGGGLPPHCLQILHGVPGLAVQVLEKFDVVREHLVQGPVQADIHTDGGGDRHQHHSGENTDVGKAHGVLLHAVEEAGDGGEVVGPVVEALVGPQAFQQGDGPGGEQAVGADHHQRHCQKKKEHGLHGVFHREGEAVAPQKRHRAGEHQQPFGPGLPLPGMFAVQEFHRLGPVQPQEVAQQRQGHQRGEEDGRLANSRQADGKAEQHRQMGHFQHHQQHQLGQENARQNPSGDHRRGAEKRLPAHHQGDVPLLQPQDVVKAQLLLPPLHDEAVGVEQDDSGEERHHKAPHAGQGLEVHGSPDGFQGLMAREEAEDVVHGRNAAAGEEIGPVVPPVSGQVHQSQPGEKAGFTHGTHRLARAQSACRRCGGTGTPESPRPGRAGGTPARPAERAPFRRGWRP